MPRAPQRKARNLAAAAGVALLLAIGAMMAPLAAAHGEAAIHDVLIVAHDNGTTPTNATKFWFTVPAKIPTGWVEFIFENHGSQSHEAQVFRVKDGHTQQDLFNALTIRNPAASIQAVYRVSDVVGGSASIEPGMRQDAISWVRPGRYVLVCFDSTPSGTPHFLLGMFKGFSAVPGPSGTRDPDERVVDGHPAYSGTVTLGSYFITMPAQAHARGFHTFKVVDVSSQAHQMQLIPLPPGANPTRAQVLACFNNQPSCPFRGPPPDGGGIDAIGPHSSAYVELYLHPGRYIAACFIPDIRTGMPHALMGMFTIFTVR